jgi:hypothetical protein
MQAVVVHRPANLSQPANPSQPAGLISHVAVKRAVAMEAASQSVLIPSIDHSMQSPEESKSCFDWINVVTIMAVSAAVSHRQAIVAADALREMP